MYYVYVLKSLKDSKNYVGFTNDLNKRFENHNAGKVSSTRDRRPFELIYFEEFETKVLAENEKDTLRPVTVELF